MKTDPSKVSTRRTYIIRPMKGLNSDTEPMSIQPGEASAGSNFRVHRGVLRRRPSFSRIGMSINVAGRTNRAYDAVTQIQGTDIANTSFPSGTRILTREGIIQLASPLAVRGGNWEGTVAITNGSTTVTGTGTSFITRGAHPGASLTVGTTGLRIRSVNSDTSLTVVTAPNSTGSGLSYDVARYVMNATFSGGAMEISPDLSEMMVGHGTTVGPGGIVRWRETFSSTAATSTRGNNYVSIPVADFNALSVEQRTEGWFGYSGRLSDTETNVSNRLDYKITGRNTVGSDYRIYLLERMRGNVTAGHTYWIKTGYGNALDVASHTRASVFMSLPAGTVSVNQGSTILNGIGANFQSQSLLAGDEIGVQSRFFRIASVQGQNALTLGQAYAGSTYSGSYRTRQWRTVTAAVTDSSGPNDTATVPNIPNAAKTVRFHSWPFSSLSEGTLTQRPTIISGIIPDPRNAEFSINNPTQDASNFESVFVCSGNELDNFNALHNIFWNFPPIHAAQFPGLVRGLTHVSQIAPKAKLIEFWNGRLVAGDVTTRGLFASFDIVERQPNLVIWTRPNEPFSWWNQFSTDGAGEDDIGVGEGAMRAIKVLPGNGALVIYKSVGISMLVPTGDAINPFGRIDYLGSKGPAGSHAVVQTSEGHVIFTDAGDLFLFTGSQHIPIPYPVSNTVKDSLNKPYAHWTMGLHDYFRDRVMFFYPTTSQRGLTEAIVWERKEGAFSIWTFTDTPLDCVFFVDSIDSSKENRLMAVDANGNILAMREPDENATGFDFVASVGGGTLYTTRWETGDIALPVGDVNSEGRNKLVDSVEVLYDSDPNLGGTLAVDVSGDGGQTYVSFGNVSLRPGTVTGTRSTLSGGGQVTSVYHRVRLTQTPNNTNVNQAMGVKALKINYVDQGESTP